MAHKVNPIAVRLNLNRNFDSSWFSDYYYTSLLLQDLNLNRYLNSIRQPSGNRLGFRVGRCIIHHLPKQSVIHLCCLATKHKSKRRLEHNVKFVYPFNIRSRNDTTALETPYKHLTSDWIQQSQTSQSGYKANSALGVETLSDSSDRFTPQFKHKVMHNLLYRLYDYLHANGFTEPQGARHRFLSVLARRLEHHKAVLTAQEAVCIRRLAHQVARLPDNASQLSTTKHAQSSIQPSWPLTKPYNFAKRSQDSTTSGPLNHKRVFVEGSNLLCCMSGWTDSVKNLIRLESTKRASAQVTKSKSKTQSEVALFWNQTVMWYLAYVKIRAYSYPQPSSMTLHQDMIESNWTEPILIQSHHYHLYNIQTLISNHTNTMASLIPIKVASLYQSASFIAQEVCCKLEHNKSFRQITKTMFQQMEACKYIKGIRINCSGRLNGAEIAKTECKQFGQTSLHVFSDQIDYAYSTASTAYGILGVKVWVSYI